MGREIRNMVVEIVELADYAKQGALGSGGFQLEKRADIGRIRMNRHVRYDVATRVNRGKANAALFKGDSSTMLRENPKYE